MCGHECDSVTCRRQYLQWCYEVLLMVVVVKFPVTRGSDIV